MEDIIKIFKAVPSPILVLKPDAKFTIAGATNAYLTATMTEYEAIVGRGLFEVFPDNPDDPSASGVNNLRHSLQEVLRTYQKHVMAIQRYDIALPAEKGGGFEVRYWRPQNVPVIDNGQIIYIIHKVEDITPTLTLQQEIEKKSALLTEKNTRINIILDALLKYTTMDFSEKLQISENGDELDAIAVGINSVVEELDSNLKRLTELNTQFEYANKELDSFSYSVSHDLRAPLRAVNGYAQVLLEDYGNLLNEDGKDLINTIIKNAAKMGYLIDDLLTFSRVGKQNITKVKLSMNSLVEPIIKDFKDQKADIAFDLKPLKNTEADASMVRQVFTNLISNAVKYSGKKEKPFIEIGSSEAGDNIVYYVKDNGTGFDMKYYDKLFGVFQRLHSASEFEGTGVGLALVQRIVKKHRGEIWAEAKLDEGATFYFSLPINK